MIEPASARTPPRHRRSVRWGHAALVLAIVAALVPATRELLRLRAQRLAVPRRSGTLVLPGLEAPVEVARDERGVPHLLAAGLRDAYAALGFVHARDRLAEMEWLRRLAEGRTAEVLGPGGLEADRLARRLGIARVARREAGLLAGSERRALEAYATGVSAWIEAIRSGRARPPRPLARLGIRPRPWRVEDSLALAKLWAWELDGGLETARVLGEILERLGGFAARPFFPPSATEVLAPGEGLRPVLAPGLGAPDPLRRALAAAGPSLGSDAWLVGPAFSASGAALLAGSLHLAPTRPALFYEAALRAPELSLAGVTLPGVPVFWSGRNATLAWAGVHARAWVSQLFIESLDPGDRSRYREGTSWRRLREHEEKIPIRGRPPERLRVLESRHGPVIEFDREHARALALAWPGRLAGRSVAAMLRAQRAASASAFRAALAELREPVLLFLYADRTGRGGLQLAGWIPRRALRSGLVPAPGRVRSYDWKGRIPFADLPHRELDPGTEWLIASDAPLPLEAAGVPLEWRWRLGERARRAERRLADLAERGPIGLGDLAQLFEDVVSEPDLERVHLALAAAGPRDRLGRGAREIAGQLAAWDGKLLERSPTATAYHLFASHLLRRLLEPRLGRELLERYLALPEPVAGRLLTEVLVVGVAGEGEAAELVSPDDVRRAVRASLRDTAHELAARLGPGAPRRAWGRVHRLSFTPLGWPPWAWETGWRSSSWPYSGDGTTLLEAPPDLSSRSFRVRVAGVYRFALDVGDDNLMLSALAPGPSEHPRDPLAWSGFDSWRQGGVGVLVLHPLLAATEARTRLRLLPGAEP